jgi:hypothetical protein
MFQSGIDLIGAAFNGVLVGHKSLKAEVIKVADWTVKEGTAHFKHRAPFRVCFSGYSGVERVFARLEP